MGRYFPLEGLQQLMRGASNVLTGTHKQDAIYQKQITVSV
jgi:hypothetical protein